MRKNLLLFVITALCAQFSFAQTPVKKVLIEEFTGAWCGWCPDGAVVLDDIKADYPGQVIALALHNGDAMVTAIGNQCINFFTNSFPSGVVDRMQAGNDALSRGTWESNAVSRMQTSTPVSVSLENATFNAVDSRLTVTVKASFVSNVSGTLRPTLLIYEDNVTGTGTGYNQANYTNTTAGHPYQGAGNPIVGYVHNHVVRSVASSSYFGSSGQFPSSINSGDSFEFTYTVYVNPNWDINELHIVGIVGRFEGPSAGQREVLNAEEVGFSTLVGIESPALGSKFLDAYPNPFSGNIQFSFELSKNENLSVEIYNTLGQKVETVASGMMNQGVHTLNWNAGSAENGVYIARLTTESGANATKKIILNR